MIITVPGEVKRCGYCDAAPICNQRKRIRMIDLTGVQHHPAIDEIVEVLCNKTQNTDRGFFRTEVSYFLAKMASNMRHHCDQRPW